MVEFTQYPLNQNDVLPSLWSRFEGERERGSVQPKALLKTFGAMAVVGALAFVVGGAGRNLNGLRSLYGVQEVLEVDRGSGVVTDIIEVEPNTTFAETRVMANGVTVELKRTRSALGNEIDLQEWHKDEFNGEVASRLGTLDAGATITREFDAANLTARVEIQEDALNALTYIVNPLNPDNHNPTHGIGVIPADILNTLTEGLAHRGIPGESIPRQLSALTELYAQELASLDCSRAAWPQIEPLLEKAIALHTIDVAKDVDPVFAGMTVDDVEVILPAADEINIENQYTALLRGVEEEVEGRDGMKLIMSDTSPENPRCKVDPASINIEFLDNTPQREVRYEGASNG